MDFDERKWRRGTIIRNIAVSPIVLLVRLPIMLVAIPMVWLGERIGRIGDALPGFRSLS